MPMEPRMLLRYRLSTSIVLGALAATAAVFVFARPQYRDPFPGEQFDLSYAKAPVSGWRWSGGTPGFRFGHDEGAWNDARLRADDLAGARVAARRSGVEPDSLRVLSVTRARGGELFALLAGSGPSGRTCLGVVVPHAPAAFACRLDRQAAFVIGAPGPPDRTAKDGPLYPLYLLGVVRADVTRVTLDLPGLMHSTIYSRSAFGYWWGSFGGPLELPSRWRGRLAFYGQRGLLASAAVSWRSQTRLLEP
jgi:hypothetical protein